MLYLYHGTDIVNYRVIGAAIDLSFGLVALGG